MAVLSPTINIADYKTNGVIGRAIANLAYQPTSGLDCASGRTFRPRRLERKQRITEMLRSVILKAERQFAASQKKDKKALKEKEKARQERAEQVARLRALRLEKEAADKEAAAGKAAAKKKKSPRPARG